MAAIKSLGQAISKIRPNIALGYLKPSCSSPLAPSRLIIRNPNNVVRSFSAMTNIPAVGYEHRPETPGERVMSSLSIFDLSHDVLDTYPERKQALFWSSQRSRRQEGGNTIGRAQQEEQDEKEKEEKNGSASDLVPLADSVPADSGRGNGWTTERRSEQEGQSSQGADTGIGIDGSVPDHKSGYNGGGDGGVYDGSDSWDFDFWDFDFWDIDL